MDNVKCYLSTVKYKGTFSDVIDFIRKFTYTTYNYAQVHTQRIWKRPFVKLQNLSWFKTGFVLRQVLHLLSKLHNWFVPKRVNTKPA